MDGEERVLVEPVEPAIRLAVDADDTLQPLLDGRNLAIPEVKQRFCFAVKPFLQTILRNSGAMADSARFAVEPIRRPGRSRPRSST